VLARGFISCLAQALSQVLHPALHVVNVKCENRLGVVLDYNLNAVEEPDESVLILREAPGKHVHEIRRIADGKVQLELSSVVFPGLDHDGTIGLRRLRLLRTIRGLGTR
jgi:hypothetical protein